tara:strand:+ start:889 stop:1026 length:138 start_codon:yes stop_codon:yes gene_type:complete
MEITKISDDVFEVTVPQKLRLTKAQLKEIFAKNQSDNADITDALK